MQMKCNLYWDKYLRKIYLDINSDINDHVYTVNPFSNGAIYMFINLSGAETGILWKTGAPFTNMD